MTELNNEAYLAGCFLIEGGQVVPVIRGIVSPEDFAAGPYRAIFAAALDLEAAGDPVDPVSIQSRARRDGVVLSAELLTELMEIVPTTANCTNIALRVAEDARRRRVQELAQRVAEDEAATADELLATLQREAQAIQGGGFQRGLLSPTAALRRFSDAVAEAGAGADRFVKSGYVGLDELLGGGFIRGGLYILGARPAVGKTTFALNLADNIAGNCLFVSLEMSSEQITAKRVSRVTGLPASRLLAGRLSEREWETVGLAMSGLSEKGIYLNSRVDLTVPQVQILAQAVPDLRAVFVDYLGLLRPTTRGGSIYEAVCQVSRDLKRMALSLDVPVVCLCQLSRAVEGREDKRPRLSDLRDSGSIEQDADAVLFLFRGDLYTGGPEGEAPSLIHLDAPKNRHGRTGSMAFSAWFQSNIFKEVP